ncbi:MAG: hypothetical protein JNM62_15300 [Flavobacteriales bacterium]|nr:hypothetical protein [Flavobacteriales bacterium]
MHLRSTLPFLFVLSLFSCKKEDDAAPVVSAPAALCGIAGARLQASFAGESFCANASLFGDLGADVITINGISTAGMTLTLELDSLEVGTYAMTTDVNHALYTTGMGLAYESSDATPATLTIDSHDTGSNRIRGSVMGPLTEPLGGTSATITASFDITYIE